MAECGGLLLVGVGGQGVIMASSIAAAALIAAGHDVKQSEVHGMAQRGGIVFSHLRFGHRVASPLVSRGSADAVVAFEWAEALRWLPYLRPGGTLVASVERIVPLASCSDRRTWDLAYPPVDGKKIADWAGDLRLVDARKLASSLGNARAAGSVLLGILSTLLDVPQKAWEAAVAAGVPPQTTDANLRAFRAGRAGDFLQPPAWSFPPPLVRRAVPSIEITPAWCKGCDVCVRFCPEHCLALDDEAMVVAVRPELCTGCRLCELLCPDFAIDIKQQVVPFDAAPNGRAAGAGVIRAAAAPPPPSPRSPRPSPRQRKPRAAQPGRAEMTEATVGG